ncbi:MAG: hydrolase, partial [Candidatus Marinimicrobia bacterium]|nr:hydrolase [Candidatus Neomarinimicrobiota bacterium]
MKKILFNCLFLFSFLTSQNVTSAVKATSNPVMDGDVLNDLAWNDVPAVTTFIQKTPDEGDSVSENTVVKVMYSDKIFYVSVVCYDSKPNEIVISDTRRDSPLNNSDSFSFIIDTFQ